MASTITVQQSVNLASAFARYKQLNVGVANEPAISCANILLQAILAPPFVWNWNRVSFSFTTTQGVQDYSCAVVEQFGFIERAYYNLAGIPTSVARTSNVSTILVPNNFSQGDIVEISNVTNDSDSFEGTFVLLTATSTQITFNNPGGDISPTAITGTLPVVSDLSSTKEIPVMTGILGADSQQGSPQYIAPLLDNGANSITMRMMPVPDQTYQVTFLYQEAPSLISSLSDTWAPVPDYYSHVFQNGFIALMLAYTGDQRWVQFNQKFVGSLLAVAQGLNDTQKNLFMQTWAMTMTETQVAGMRAQAGANGVA